MVCRAKFLCCIVGLQNFDEIWLSSTTEVVAAAQVSSSSAPAAEWSAALQPPVQVADQLQSLSLADAASRNSDGASEGVPPPDEHLNGGSGAAVLARWPEFAGAFLLYFVCIPPTPQVDNLLQVDDCSQ